jgi:HPt (histidine-containing phosphotransfer) domain-containing protein
MASIDIEHLDAATYGDHALKREVLQLFASQAVNLISIISSGTAETRSAAAHALKGAALGIGAFALAKAAEAVELGEADALARLVQLATEARSEAERLAA